jgi:TctA family transporter
VEINLQRSLVLAEGSPLIFVSDPLAIVLVVSIVGFFYIAIIKPLLEQEAAIETDMVDD